MPFDKSTADWAKGHLDGLRRATLAIKELFEKRGEPLVVKDLDRALMSISSARAHLEGR